MWRMWRCGVVACIVGVMLLLCVLLLLRDVACCCDLCVVLRVVACCVLLCAFASRIEGICSMLLELNR